MNECLITRLKSVVNGDFPKMGHFYVNADADAYISVIFTNNGVVGVDNGALTESGANVGSEVSVPAFVQKNFRTTAEGRVYFNSKYDLNRLLASDTTKPIDITGLEYSHGITYLNIPQSEGNINFLSKLDNLKHLTLKKGTAEGVISHLSDTLLFVEISSMPNLKINTTSFSGNTTIETLNIRNSMVGNIYALNQMAKIKTLIVSGQLYGDISSLANLTTLIRLEISSSDLQITGEIQSLGTLVNVGKEQANMLDFRGTSVTGSIIELCNALHMNGRISGSLYFRPNGRVTMPEGIVGTVDGIFKIDFSSSGWQIGSI